MVLAPTGSYVVSANICSVLLPLSGSTLFFLLLFFLCCVVLCRRIVITDESGANPSFFMSIGTAIRTEPQSSIAMEAFAKARAAPIILMARRRAEDRRRT